MPPKAKLPPGVEELTEQELSVLPPGVEALTPLWQQTGGQLAQTFESGAQLVPPNVALPMAAGIVTGGASLPIQAGAQMLTTGAMQAAGMEQFSPGQIGLSGALPFAAGGISRAVGAGARFIGRHLPGAAGALHKEVEEQAKRQLPALIRMPGQASADDLFALVDQMGSARIPTVDLKAQLKAIVDDVAQKSKGAQRLYQPAKQWAKGLLEKFEQYGDDVPLAVFNRERRDLNQFLANSAPELRPYGDRMFAAMSDTLEKAAQGGNQALPAARTLVDAIGRMKAEKAQAELADVIMTKVISPPRAGDAAQSVDFKPLLKWLDSKQASLFRRTISDAELRAIRRTAEEFQRALPKLPPPRGAMAGSMIPISQAGGGAAAAFFGLKLEPAAAAFAGMAVPAVSTGISRLLMTEPGRRFLLNFLRSTGGVITDRTGTILVSAARSMAASSGMGFSPASVLSTLAAGEE